MDFAPLSKTSRVKPYRFASGFSVSVRRPVCLFPCQSYVVGSRALCSWSLSVVGCASALGALPPHLGCAASDRSGWKTPVSQARSAWGFLVPDPVRDRTACGALVCGYGRGQCPALCLACNGTSGDSSGKKISVQAEEQGGEVPQARSAPNPHVPKAVRAEATPFEHL